MIAFIALAACTDAPDAKRTLENQGYTNVKAGGYAAFSCDSESDLYATNFEAISPSGTPVTGAVCKGVFKGSTIRFD